MAAYELLKKTIEVRNWKSIRREKLGEREGGEIFRAKKRRRNGKEKALSVEDRPNAPKALCHHYSHQAAGGASRWKRNNKGGVKTDTSRQVTSKRSKTRYSSTSVTAYENDSSSGGGQAYAGEGVKKEMSGKEDPFWGIKEGLSNRTYGCNLVENDKDRSMRQGQN